MLTNSVNSGSVCNLGVWAISFTFRPPITIRKVDPPLAPFSAATLGGLWFRGVSVTQIYRERIIGRHIGSQSLFSWMQVADRITHTHTHTHQFFQNRNKYTCHSEYRLIYTLVNIYNFRKWMFEQELTLFTILGSCLKCIAMVFRSSGFAKSQC